MVFPDDASSWSDAAANSPVTLSSKVRKQYLRSYFTMRSQHRFSWRFSAFSQLYYPAAHVFFYLPFWRESFHSVFPPSFQFIFVYLRNVCFPLTAAGLSHLYVAAVVNLYVCMDVWMYVCTFIKSGKFVAFSA